MPSGRRPCTDNLRRNLSCHLKYWCMAHVVKPFDHLTVGIQERRVTNDARTLRDASQESSRQEPNHHIVLPSESGFTDVYLFSAPIDIGEGDHQSLRTCTVLVTT